MEEVSFPVTQRQKLVARVTQAVLERIPVGPFSNHLPPPPPNLPAQNDRKQLIFGQTLAITKVVFNLFFFLSQTYTTKVQEVKQTKTITETMRVVDDDGNIIKTGDPETDAVSEPAERRP